MVAEHHIRVEVAYALPHDQTLLALEVDAGSTVEQIIQQSGILTLHPELDLQHNPVGVFSRPVKLSDTVQSGDRIELYRPLLADPKEIRRRRAQQAIAEGRADKVTGGRPNPLRGGGGKEDAPKG